MTRHEARRLAVIALYHYDFEHGSISSSFEIALTFGGEIYEINTAASQFCEELFHGTVENLAQIDTIISRNLSDWTLERLSYVDRAIIRLAVYELAYTNTPFVIAINEALELTKLFSALDDQRQTKFNNKLLDKIGKELEDGKIT